MGQIVLAKNFYILIRLKDVLAVILVLFFVNIIQEINSIWSKYTEESYCKQHKFSPPETTEEATTTMLQNLSVFVVSIFQTRKVQRHIDSYNHEQHCQEGTNMGTKLHDYRHFMSTHFIDLLLVKILAYSSFSLSLHSF